MLYGKSNEIDNFFLLVFKRPRTELSRSVHLLPIDKAVNAVLQNTLHFLLHFLFLCQLNFCHFRCGVNTHSGAKDLQTAHTLAMNRSVLIKEEKECKNKGS